MSGVPDYLFWVAVGLIAVALAAFLGSVWWTWPAKLVPDSITSPKERAELADDYRKTIAQFVGGVGFVATFFFTIYQFQVQHQLSVSQQANQQFADAAKLLGEKSPGTQAAGFHAMGNLAAARDEYVTPVLHTIASYIRGRGPSDRTPYPAGISTQDLDYPGAVSSDIRAAVFVLNRLDPSPQVKVDLQHAYLVQADFSDAKKPYIKADFSGAILYGANFERAELRKVHFDGSQMADWEAYDINANEYSHVEWDHIVHFKGANLMEATFDHVWIGHADFREACLAGTSFWDADLSRSSFQGADFGSGAIIKDCFLPNRKPEEQKAGFVEARLNRVVFTGADLGGVDFRRACLAGAMFSGANLSGALFGGADFGDKTNSERCVFETDGKKLKTNFIGATLRSADFDDVNIAGASFTEADISGADFSKARNLEEANFVNACFDPNVPPLPASAAIFHNLKPCPQKRRE